MNTPNRECQVCGKAYYFCNCGHNKDKFVWKMNCCTPQHFQVFMTALDVRDGIIDAEEARERLARIGFTKRNLAGCTQAVSNILTPVFQRKKKDPEEEVVEGE